MLIVVMVICLGLVSLTLLFGHTMLMAYLSADNGVAGHQADQAAEGAARYAEYVIANTSQGAMPDPTAYQSEAAPIDDGTFWFIGEPISPGSTDTPAFSLVDEASKLNLNTASSTMLMQLPAMTQALATAITQWRTSGTGGTSAGSASSTTPNKNAPFESMEELALLSGTDPSVLYGEDANLNHVLDPNEVNSQNASSSIAGGGAQFGLLEYVTVFSREPNVLSDGTTPRLDVTKLSSRNRSELIRTLTTALGDSRQAEQITNHLFPPERPSEPDQPAGPPPNSSPEPRAEPAPLAEPTPPPHREPPRPSAPALHLNSVLAFYAACPSDVTDAEFDAIAPYLTGTTTSSRFVTGLINVNTASEAVLACVPGLANVASQLVSTRMSRTQPSTGFAWVKSVLGNQAAIEAGPYLTWRTYQITADVAAVGRHGRGYRRTQFIIDSSLLGAPQIVYRRNLAGLGWAVGSGTNALDTSGTDNTQ